MLKKNFKHLFYSWIYQASVRIKNTRTVSKNIPKENIFKMKLNLTLKNFFSMILILYQCRADRQNSNWLNHLVQYITENSATYQTMLIVDKDPRINNITSQILKTVPSLKISFNKTKFDYAKNLTNSPLFQSPRSTLFILIQFSNDNLYSSRLTEQIKFISEISPVRIRPKCLVIVLHQENSILRKDFLRSLWSSHFLDFTILELVQKTSKSDFSFGNHQIVVMIHFYNPFTQTYIRKKWSPKSDFFPNKLIDMNGFEMLVGSYAFPTYIDAKRNLTGHILNASGPGILLRDALSKAMNFTITEIPFNNNYGWGKLDCDRSKTTGLFCKLAYNQIRFVTNAGVIHYKWDQLTEKSRSIGFFGIFPIVPILHEKLPSTPTQTMFFKTIIIIGSIMVLNCFLLRALKFDANFWTLSHMFQIVVAIPILQSPRRPAENVVFGSFLIASLLYSSTIFFSLTDVKLTKDSEVNIQRFEDLQNWNLQLRMSESVRSVITFEDEKDNMVKNLLNKSEIFENEEDCIRYLIKHKNISCVMSDGTIEIILNKYKNNRTWPAVKIGKPCFLNLHLSFRFEPRSPYVERFDQVLSRLIQAGLSISSVPPSSKNYKSLQDVENEMVTHIRNPLILIVSIGFLTSFAVFICELFVFFLRKKN